MCTAPVKPVGKRRLGAHEDTAVAAVLGILCILGWFVAWVLLKLLEQLHCICSCSNQCVCGIAPNRSADCRGNTPPDRETDTHCRSTIQTRRNSRTASIGKPCCSHGSFCHDGYLPVSMTSLTFCQALWFLSTQYAPFSSNHWPAIAVYIYVYAIGYRSATFMPDNQRSDSSECEGTPAPM